MIGISEELAFKVSELTSSLMTEHYLFLTMETLSITDDGDLYY